VGNGVRGGQKKLSQRLMDGEREGDVAVEKEFNRNALGVRGDRLVPCAGPKRGGIAVKTGNRRGEERAWLPKGCATAFAKPTHLQLWGPVIDN